MQDAARSPDPPVRLTSLAHGGGCGCKLAPGGAAAEILGGMPAAAAFAEPDGRDRDQRRRRGLAAERHPGAGGDHRLLHAGGRRPVRLRPHRRDQRALRRLRHGRRRRSWRWPSSACRSTQLPPETIGAILAGGAAVCAAAGVPVAGGHSIDSVEPIYGLVALGLVHPDQVLTNRGARAGDVLILTKALGVGVLSAAFKQERLSPAGYAALIASTTQLNTLGARAGAASAGVQRGDRRHRLRPAGPRAGDEPRRRPGDRDRRGRAGAAAGRRGAGAGRRAHRRLDAATGRATATRCACRRTCRTGAATCSPTRRPAAAC